MSRYSKGARFERRVKKYLEDLGFYCVRSAGSRGEFDIVAFKCIVFGIQVKIDEKKIRYEKDKLIEAEAKYKIIPLFAVRRGRKIVFIDPHRYAEVDIEDIVKRLP